MRGALRERARRAAAEADQERRAAEHDSAAPAGTVAFCTWPRADRADAAGEHHRLVIAARAAVRQLEGAEVAEDRGAAELVVERGAAERALGHDVERGRDPRRRADPARGRRLPRLERAGDPQVGDREPDEARLRLAAAAGRALVADLAAGAGRRAGERRDRGRVVVGLDLAEDVHGLA